MTAPGYQSGFANHFVSEAVPGAVPAGRNSPQMPPLGLYAELLSGMAFTAPRVENRRTWTYRIQPSAMHRPYRRIPNGRLLSAPLNEVETTPSQLRWNPQPIPQERTDFIDGLITMGANGDVRLQTGMSAHLYAANASMSDRYFYNADGEMLVVPQQGRVRFVTELGVIDIAPGEVAVIPCGVRFRVELPDGPSRGYVCENYGAMFRLPELGPLGSNGLANPRDFLAPIAAYEDEESPCEVVAKFQGNLWAAEMRHSPLNVVGWHGNLAPYKYDLANFMAVVREHVGWEVPLSVDHLGHIGVHSCIRLAGALEKYNPAWLEDMIPWQRTEQLKEIKDHIAVPLCTGEDIYLKEAFIELAKNHSIDIAHPDLATSGGILETKKIGDALQEYGVPMAMHFAGSPVSCMANVHCAAATENFLVLENHSVDVPWWSDLVDGVEKPIVNKGFVTVPDKPGLGITLNDEVMKQHLLEPGYFEPTPQWDKENQRINDRLFS